MATISIILDIINLVMLFGWIAFGIYMTVSRSNIKRDYKEYAEKMEDTTNHLHSRIKVLEAENTLYKNQRDFYHDLLEKEREIRKK